MDAKYITWNFANFISVNLMVAVLAGLIMLAARYSKENAAMNGAAQKKAA
jgi:hypothetical protein